MTCLFAILVLDVWILAVCVLAVFYVYFKISFNYWKKRNVPYAKPTFPFGNFGDMLFLKASNGHLFENIFEKLDGEKYGGTYALTKPGFIFRDPDIIKNVLVKDFSSFHDRGFYMNEEREPLTGHLFLLRGKRWRNLRVNLSPTFTSGKMKMSSKHWLTAESNQEPFWRKVLLMKRLLKSRISWLSTVQI